VRRNWGGGGTRGYARRVLGGCGCGAQRWALASGDWFVERHPVGRMRIVDTIAIAAWSAARLARCPGGELSCWSAPGSHVASFVIALAFYVCSGAACATRSCRIAQYQVVAHDVLRNSFCSCRWGTTTLRGSLFRRLVKVMITGLAYALVALAGLLSPRGIRQLRIACIRAVLPLTGFSSIALAAGAVRCCSSFLLPAS